MSQDTIESLRQQLAEVTNEKREYQLEAQGQIEFLDKKLAECQAQEAKLREALKRLDSVANISCGSVTKALALPDNSTEILQEWLDKQFGEPVGYAFIGAYGLSLVSEACRQDEQVFPVFRKPEIK